MTLTDTTARSQTESLSFDFDFPHAPEKVWRALTEPELLKEWLLPVIGLKLERGSAFTFKTDPVGGWDGIVHCRIKDVAHTHRDRHPVVPRALGLQGRSEEELRRCALRLEDDGRQTRQPAPEDPMSYWIRQIHRWTSIVFTLTVIANFVMIGLKKQIDLVTYSPLLPLFLLLFTGLYMFVLPYVARRRKPARSLAS
jgi:hypothetical protein